jgi:RNA-directed DNA polymerase
VGFPGATHLVILIDAERRSDWLVKAVNRRLREELAKLRVVVNEDKSRMVDLKQGESFTFLGFEYRRILSLKRKWRPYYAPKLKKRTALFERLRELFRQHISWPVETVIEKINPILRGWVNYFRVGHSSRLYDRLGLFNDYRLYRWSGTKAVPARYVT